MKTLSVALRVALVTLVVSGVLYPLAVTVLAHLMFPHQASGSFITDDTAAVVGSELIAQEFRSPAYIHPRPSAVGWNAAASGGSNLGPTSRVLRERVITAVAAERAASPAAIGALPAELVTTSASGLDPHLSPQAARWQVTRVAAARGVAPERVQAVIDAYVEGRTLGFLGEPRVNVLLVNLALDRRFGAPASPAARPAP